MPFATCPECDERIRFVEMPDVGDLVRCRTCNARLEVVSINPIVLDWPFDLDEDEEGEAEDNAEFAVFPEEEEEDEEDDLSDDLSDDLEDDL